MGRQCLVACVAVLGAQLETAQAAEPNRTTVELTSGVAVAFSEREKPTATSRASATAFSLETVMRAFTDLKACTYFGYELRARPMPDGDGVEVSLSALSPKGEERMRQHPDFVRAGCAAPRPLAAPPPRFPRPSVYADGESLSIALLKNPDTGHVLEDVVRVSRSAAGRGPRAVTRDQLAEEIGALRQALNDKEELLLATSEEDRTRFAEWLRQPDAGLARLLPRGKYDSKLTIRGGGCYYSFTTLSHSYDKDPHIELQQGELSTGFAGADFGYLAPLGNVALEGVTLEHPGVRYLATFTTPTREPQAREQQRSSGQGVKVDGFVYSRRVATLVDMSYVLRAVSYRDSDVLVVFRVVREDTDGSLILQWKKLKQFPTPDLVRE